MALVVKQGFSPPWVPSIQRGCFSKDRCDSHSSFIHPTPVPIGVCHVIFTQDMSGCLAGQACLSCLPLSY